MIKIEELMSILPHRFPMLLVDRVLECEPGKSLVALKNVTINEPFFQGHYPGTPIMPGVLIAEAMAQSGAAMFLDMPAYKGRLPLLAALDEVRFKRPVTPGDQLTMYMKLIWLKNGIGKIRGEAKVGEELACSMELTFALQPRKE